jgi:glycosyltransferase involved in cell wall biosynthesis
MTPPWNSRPLRIALLVEDLREPGDGPVPVLGSAQQALLEGFAHLRGELEIHVVSCHRGRLESVQKLAGQVYFHPVEVTAGGGLRSGYWGCVRAVRRKLREIQPDIVHGQGTERECALCAAFSGYPNVITIHGNMRGMVVACGGVFARLYYLAAAFWEIVALRWAGGVLCNSAYTEARVKPFARRRWRVPNALRSLFAEEVPDPAVRGAGPVVLLNAGTIAPHKRQVELLETFRLRQDMKSSFRLVFGGDRNEAHPYAQEFADGVRKTPGVSDLGELSSGELRKAMDASRALVHVSREESFGLVLAEAMARGLAVFAFDVGGIAEVVEGMDQAWVVREGDWDALWKALEKWESMGAPSSTNARNLALERFDSGRVAEKHLELYREMIGTSCANRNRSE